MANHRRGMPDWMDTQYIQNSLQVSYNDPDLVVDDISLEPGSSVGDNYTCQIIRITATISNSSVLEGTIKLIAKIQHGSALLDSLGEEANLFGKEARFFGDIQSQFNEILPEYVDIERYWPRCILIDRQKTTILLDDMKDKGFQLEIQGKALDLQQATLGMLSLATLHGVSLRLLKISPKLKEGFGPTIWGTDDNVIVGALVANASKVILNNIDEYDLPDKSKEKLLRLEADAEEAKSVVGTVREEDINVITHGDFWKNNMMFRFNDEVAEEITVLDFQCMNYNSFANDLQYFLFTSVATDVLTKELDNLLEIYYNKLVEIAPEELALTFDRIKSGFSARGAFGYFLFIVIRPILLANEATDLEQLFGEDGGNEIVAPYQSETFLTDLQQLMPIFEDAGLLE